MEILFVCTGNTCRSPMAEHFLRRAFEERGVSAVVSSAGTNAGAAGLPASEHARKVMADIGHDLSLHASRQVTQNMIEQADVVVALTRSHKDRVLAICGGLYQDKIVTLHAFAGNGDKDVADPYLQGAAIYEACRNEIEEAVRKMADQITRRPVAVGCDHGGFALKQNILKRMAERGVPFTDFGCYDESGVDYPVYADKVAEAVLSGACGRGVLVCGTGIGISIAANRKRGIRCALCHDVFSAKAARQHNDANILALGGRVLGPGPALEVLDAFLDTPFSGDERHARRVGMLDA